MSKGHVTHFDDCGCLTALYEARVATLEAELAASRTDATLAWAEAKLIGEDEDAANLNAANWQAHANALRDALEKIRGCMGWDYGRGMDAPEDVLEIAITALDATPAASLRSHDAEVLEPYKSALRVFIDNGDLDTYEESFAAEVRALAAQEVTK